MKETTDAFRHNFLIYKKYTAIQKKSMSMQAYMNDHIVTFGRNVLSYMKYIADIHVMIRNRLLTNDSMPPFWLN